LNPEYHGLKRCRELPCNNEELLAPLAKKGRPDAEADDTPPTTSEKLHDEAGLGHAEVYNPDVECTTPSIDLELYSRIKRKCATTGIVRSLTANPRHLSLGEVKEIQDALDKLLLEFIANYRKCPDVPLSNRYRVACYIMVPSR
jgi:hypothetical protein